jgi:hypothetical protein
MTTRVFSLARNVLTVTVVLLAAPLISASAAETGRPNILIFADDLGYGDIGPPPLLGSTSSSPSWAVWPKVGGAD